MEYSLSNTVTFDLPQGASTPEYVIGQSVEFRTGRGKPVYIPGIVVGMRWVSSNAALEDQCYPGWEYVIEVEPFQGLPLHWSNVDAEGMRLPELAIAS